MANTSIFKMPYPQPGDHTRLWEHYQALAEQIEKMAVGQFDEATGASVVALTTTTPVDLCSLDIYGRAGIPIRAVLHVWTQTNTSAAVRFGVAFSGGGLDVPSNGSPFSYNSSFGPSSLYVGTQREVVAVPTTDGIVTVTAQAWLNQAGTGQANYSRLSAETRAWT